MLKQLIKKPSFLIGSAFILLLFFGSIIYSIQFKGPVPQTPLLYNDSGVLVDKAPLSPFQLPPFGTDKQGYHLGHQLLIGAKFTIGAAIIVTTLRMLFSVLIGVLYSALSNRINRTISGVVDSFHYVPVSLLAYYILKSVLMQDPLSGVQAYSFSERVVFELIILTLIALPTTSLLIGNEITNTLKYEFIQSARTLGGGFFHVLWKHIRPHLTPKLAVIYLQQVIQVLILLAHLGLIHLFFGGTEVHLNIQDSEFEYSSLANEWSGLIGLNYSYIKIYPWLIIAPILLFTLTIFAMNLILNALLAVIGEDGSKGFLSKKKRKKYSRKENGKVINKDLFVSLED